MMNTANYLWLYFNERALDRIEAELIYSNTAVTLIEPSKLYSCLKIYYKLKRNKVLIYATESNKKDSITKLVI